MAKNAAGRMKGIAATLFGVTIVAGLGATPFYLSLLSSPQTQLDGSLEGPVETLRRVVLALDSNVSTLSDVYASLGEESRVDDAAIKAFLAQSDKQIDEQLKMIDKGSKMGAFAKSLKLVRSAEHLDRELGTEIPGAPKVVGGRPDVRAAAEDMRNKYLTAHDKLMQKAQAAIGEFRSARTDSLSAGNHLGANRLQAILYFATARIERNRAEFEYWQASQARREAKSLVQAAARLHRDEERLMARRPATVIDVLQEQFAKNENQMSRVTGIIAQLTSFIDTQDARIAELGRTAAEARRKLTALETSGEPIHGENSTFLALSNTARDAEAEFQALRNGTLAGAEPKMGDFEDLLSATYEGGQQRAGVRDLRPRLEQLKDQLAALEESKSALLEQKEYYNGLSAELEETAQAVAAAAEKQWSAISTRMSESQEHIDSAEQAATAALQSFEKAARFAKTAATAAAKRVREARTASSDAKGPEADRLKMITGDGDTEATMQCLTADIAYYVALTRAKQMEALEAGHQTDRFIAAMLDRESPAPIDSELDELRGEAVNQLATANKAYESATKLIEKTRAKFDRRSIQGKDFVWQIQVGQAAVHMLQAALLTDPEEFYAQQAAAYDLLTAAAQDREQSPLLTPAIDTLVFLQRTVK